MNRRQFVKGCSSALAASPVLLSGAFVAPPDGTPGNRVFTRKYLDIRKRFQSDFLHEGQIAAIADQDYRKFADQTFHMGFALVTLAGEARLYANAKEDPGPTERLLHQVLQAFDQLEKAAQNLYKTSTTGFFLRDSIASWQGVKTVESDFQGAPGSDDMSIDQLISLMMGWWAVAHWSTDAMNRKLARAQAGRLMKFLVDERFMIDRPGTHTPVSGGGDDARAAAGFLCNIATEIGDEDYYGSAKVRLQHDNKCHTCAGTGLVKGDTNLQCPGCHGTGDCKIVLGGGKCLACSGSGEMKIDVQTDCPACSGSGEIRIVVTDWLGNDHTVGKSKCVLCGGKGKIGGKTELGKCKVCGGSGRLPQYVKDLGKCKMCGGSGRLKGELPRIKCPMCGGSKELNLYVHVTHPLVLALEPVALTALYAPRIGLHQGKVTVEGDNRSAAKPYVRHMNLVCLALEPAVRDDALLAAALDSKHPWAVVLRAAKNDSVCPACHGKGTLSVLAPEQIHGIDPLHMHVTYKRHDLGVCKVCNGDGHNPNPGVSRTLLTAAVVDQLLRLHKECPAEGPSARAPSIDWATDNHWERCTKLDRGNGNNRYNGLDFLSMEVLMRLAGLGARLNS